VAVLKRFETNVPAWQHKTLCSHAFQYAMTLWAPAMELSNSIWHLVSLRVGDVFIRKQKGASRKFR